MVSLYEGVTKVLLVTTTGARELLAPHFFSLDVLHDLTILSTSELILGHQTTPLANAFILDTPGCPSCKNSKLPVFLLGDHYLTTP